MRAMSVILGVLLLSAALVGCKKHVEPLPPVSTDKPAEVIVQPSTLTLPVLVATQRFNPTETTARLGDTIVFQMTAVDSAKRVAVAQTGQDVALAQGVATSFSVTLKQVGDVAVTCIDGCVDAPPFVIHVQ